MRRVRIGRATGQPVSFIEDLPASPETAIRVPGLGKCYGIGLDPASTAAYAHLGVMVGDQDAGRVHVLRPGDFLPIPGGASVAYVFHVFGWLTNRAAALGRSQ